MLKIAVKVEDQRLSDIAKALELIGSQRLPYTAQAVQTAVKAYQTRWKTNAEGAFKRPSGTYMAAIEAGGIYPHNDDPYQGAVFNSAPHAEWVENGTPPHDMKKALWTSSKVRISKKGKRYLIIPFRHGTPGSVTMRNMPQSVHVQAKNLSFSSQLSATVVKAEIRGQGRQDWNRALAMTARDHARSTEHAVGTVKHFNTTMANYRNQSMGPRGTRVKYTYRWGGRLSGMGDLDRRGAKPIHSASGKLLHVNPAWKNSPYSGMTKFPRDGGNGGKYMTFRVMTEDSKGWWHPGTPALKIHAKTHAMMEPVVSYILNQGFNQDMRNMGLTT
jgi:hypothetical protein